MSDATTNVDTEDFMSFDRAMEAREEYRWCRECFQSELDLVGDTVNPKENCLVFVWVHSVGIRRRRVHPFPSSIKGVFKGGQLFYLPDVQGSFPFTEGAG